MAGLAVVASDFPEIRKIVDQHHFGLLVDPADEDAVVKALNRLVEDSDLRERLSLAARRAALKLDWESQAPALLAVYERMFAEKG